MAENPDLAGDAGPGSGSVLAAFSAEGLAGWRAWVATDEEIDRWVAAGVDAGTAAWWTAMGRDITAPEYRGLSRQGRKLVLDGWLPNLPTERIARWYDPERDGPWNAASNVRLWAADPHQEFEPDEARRLIAAGFVHPDEYRHWQQANPRNPRQALLDAWEDINIAAETEVSDQGDLTWEGTRVARQGGLWDPALYRAWQTAAGAPANWDHLHDSRDFPILFGQDEAVTAYHAGITPSQFAEWVTDTRPANEIPGFAVMDDDDLTGVHQSTYGLTAVEWLSWFGDLDVTDKRRGDWARSWNGVHDPSVWISAGLTADARQWESLVRRTAGDIVVSLGLMGPHWPRWGFGLDDAAPWIQAVHRTALATDNYVPIYLCPLAALLRDRGVEASADTITDRLICLSG